MSDTPIYISKNGLENLKKELHYLKTDKRREVADRIEKAKELGDLRENADYTEAKEELSFAEGRIIELEDTINRAVVIEAQKSDAVTIGAKIVVKSHDKEKEFMLVGSQEADPVCGMISNESPLGQALIGKKIGEVAEVQAPSGTIRYTVIAID